MDPPPAWAGLPFWTAAWPGLRAQLVEEAGWLPGPARVFAALAAVPPDAVRVVVLGQDPYPTPGHAIGLAFAVAPGTRPLPRSLQNILAEAEADLGTAPAPDLAAWTARGVLLLNTALSVAPRAAGAHAGWGWDALARQAVAAAGAHRPLAFLLWGAQAQRALAGLPRPGTDLVIATAHPSPLSARRGFLGSRPFSRVNAWLAARGEPPAF